ncbi:MAG: hypothetical protein LUC43_05000 [Burkholderiales bacterium]|nr:hypothetical protein [Burkholderiales bacterium]
MEENANTEDFLIYTLRHRKHNNSDFGYIELARKTPDECVFYELSLMPMNNRIDTESILKDRKDPLVRISFSDGTVIELAEFNKDNPNQPYKIVCFRIGSRLASYKRISNDTGLFLAFKGLPANCQFPILTIEEDASLRKTQGYEL